MELPRNWSSCDGFSEVSLDDFFVGQELTEMVESEHYIKKVDLNDDPLNVDMSQMLHQGFVNTLKNMSCDSISHHTTPPHRHPGLGVCYHF